MGVAMDVEESAYQCTCQGFMHDFSVGLLLQHAHLGNVQVAVLKPLHSKVDDSAIALAHTKAMCKILELF